jgi:hypothetical protein
LLAFARPWVQSPTQVKHSEWDLVHLDAWGESDTKTDKTVDQHQVVK